MTASVAMPPEFGRYRIGQWFDLAYSAATLEAFAGSIPVAGGGDADYGDHENSRSQVFSLSESHLLSDGVLNEARFGYVRYRLDQLSLLDGRS